MLVMQYNKRGMDCTYLLVTPFACFGSHACPLKVL